MPRVAALVCAAEALLLLATAAILARELITGTADDASTAGMTLAVSALFAALLLVLAAHWWRGRRWPRTPTIVWNLLLLPAAWTLGTGGATALAIGLAAAAVLGLMAAWSSPPADLDETGSDGGDAAGAGAGTATGTGTGTGRSATTSTTTSSTTRREGSTRT